MVSAMQEDTADDLAVAIDTFEYVDAARLHVIASALGKRYQTLVRVSHIMLKVFVLQLHQCVLTTPSGYIMCT